MKNGNFMCTSKEGDISIFKINRRENSKKYSLWRRIFKIDDILQKNICLLSKNYISIFYSNFQIISLKKKNNDFTDFCKFSEN